MTRPDRTVFVVDDDEAMCEALEWMLESEGLEVTTFCSAEEFLEKLDRARPGCLVLDVRMRGMSGLELQATLVKQGISIPTIILTGHGDVPMAVRAVKVGAIDFLEKPVNNQVLLARVRQALKVNAQRRRAARDRARAQAQLGTLTPREYQVMRLVVGGKANKQIASRLGIREKTVEVHRRRVMEKMGKRTAVDLVRLVMTLDVPIEESN